MNVDKNKKFFNQLLDGDPDECVAISVCDIAGNIDGCLYDPDYTYAMTLQLEGVQPTTAGSDPLAGMQSAIGYGLLPISDESFTSKIVGELYAANYTNYTVEQCQEALQNAQKGMMTLGKDFEAITAYLNTYSFGVSMPMHWYESFTNIGADGVLPAPQGSFSNHNVAVYGLTDNGMLIVKPWLGSSYGDGGYCYMSRDIFNQVAQTAYAFNPNAWRFISLLGIIATRLPAFVSYIPSIVVKQTQGIPPESPVYLAAKACMGQHITLDENVAPEVGCAEAVSYVLKKAGIAMPAEGIAGTYDLWNWLKTNATLVQTPEVGDIVISPTGTSTSGSTHGHTGVVMLYGICSNDSNTGLFCENYTLDSWQHSFGDILGFPVYYFRCA